MDIAEKLECYKVTISEDGMSAKLILTPSDGVTYDVEEIVAMVIAQGVKMGLKKEVIQDMVDNHIYYEYVEIATGKPSVEGKDGEFEFLFNTDIQIKPVELEDGSVDYLNMKTYEQVNAGDVVAKYTPPTGGEFGYDVRGKLIVPKRGKNLSRIRGTGIEISEDGTTYTARISGKIEYRYGQINIYDVYDLDGDLDMTVGNIRFDGDVHIRGNVTAGMYIDASGNVEVEGHVGAVRIKSGKNVILKRGMQGKGTGWIEAAGSVSGRFFEEVEIKAGEQVEADSLLNCNVYTRNMVIVHGKFGSIIGGSTQAVLGIETRNIGNDVEKITDIRIGVSDELYMAHSNVADNIKKLTDEINRIEKGLDKVSEMREKENTKENNDMYNKLFQAKIIKVADRNRFFDKREKLFDLMNKASRAYVRVDGVLHRGVRIYISQDTKVITDEFAHVLVKKVNERIYMVSIEE